MTRIRAICPRCGEVELRPSDLLLRRVLDGDGTVTEASTYRFSCPDCACLVEKPADGRLAALLTTGGVPVEDVATAPRARLLVTLHPEMPGEGPPLTCDDLLDLHLALEDPSWFDQLVASTPR
jgi:predicted RNA-binding Zn-ribbon protein involved in translation (DUF1610 family)